MFGFCAEVQFSGIEWHNKNKTSLKSKMEATLTSSGENIIVPPAGGPILYKAKRDVVIDDLSILPRCGPTMHRQMILPSGF